MRAPLTCPGCSKPMRSLEAERRLHGAVDVDYCPDCQAIWFDTLESPALAAGGVLALFRALGPDGPSGERRSLPARLACPRCDVRLAETHDLQHATRFTYWRCPRGHGRLTPFVQFLREKDFIRPLGDAELARLRSAVKTIRCSSCGAPVDLQRATVCAYCRAPIVALDPDAVQRALGTLSAAPASSAVAPDPGRGVEALLTAQREAERESRSRLSLSVDPGTPIVDLVDLGLRALAALWRQ